MTCASYSWVQHLCEGLREVRFVELHGVGPGGLELVLEQGERGVEMERFV